VDVGQLTDIHQRVLPFFADDYPRIANLTDAQRRITYNTQSPANELTIKYILPKFDARQ